MRSLPHIVIACGTVWAGSRLVGRLRSGPDGVEPSGGSVAFDAPDGAVPAHTSPLVDFRLVALGALLPDLVDKTIGRRLYRDERGYNEHTFGHTFLFMLAMLVPGLRMATSRGDPRLLAVAAASLTHLLVDPVIRAPRALFWPLLGLRFPRVDGLGRLATLGSQLMAGLLLLAVGWRLAIEGRLGRLIRAGHL